MCSAAAEDSDAPKSVEEKLQHRTKVTLMKQFSWAAAACVACYVVALILPLFYFSQPGEEDTAVLVVLILWNCVRWLFLAGLCFIFRWVCASMGMKGVGRVGGRGGLIRAYDFVYR